MKLWTIITIMLVTGALTQFTQMGFLCLAEEAEDSTDFYEEQAWEDLRYSMEIDSGWFSPIVHFIAGPVDINCSTGEVVIAEGADISSASIKFWRSLEAAYPYLFDERRNYVSESAKVSYRICHPHGIKRRAQI